MSGSKGKKKELMIQMLTATVGSLMFAIGVNLIIVPLGLYNGGFMGIAQLMRTAVVDFLHVPVPGNFDLSGIIYWILNIPLFYMGLRIMGKDFAVKTLITVTIQSVFLVMVPIPTTPIIGDTLTACIIGGLIAGTGVGLVLRGRSSGGGQDIIGVCCSKKYPNVSVGKINILMNIFVYLICLFLFNIEIVAYSFIYTTVLSMAIDRVHIQNINTSVMIFTKKTWNLAGNHGSDGTWSNQLGWGGRLYEQDRIYPVGNDFKIRSDTDQTNCTQHRSECIYDLHRRMFRRWKF